MGDRFQVVRLGAKFAGRCVKCDDDTGRGDDTLLLKGEDGAYRVGHPRCFGIRTKSKVGGGRDFSSAPPKFVEV